MKNLHLILLFLFGMKTLAAKEVVISGRVKNFHPGKMKIITDTYYNHKQIILGETTINKNGLFSMKISVSGGIPVYLNYIDKEVTQLFIEPSDSLNVFFDARKFHETLHFSGKGAGNNNFLAQSELRYDDMVDRNYYALKNYDEKTYVNFVDSLANDKQSFLEKNSTFLSEDFKNYLHNEIIYEQAAHKLELNSKRNFKTTALARTDAPLFFENVATGIKVQNNSALNASHYWLFLMYYFSNKGQIEFLKTYDSIKTESDITTYNLYCYELMKRELSGEVRDINITHEIINMLNWGEEYFSLTEKIIEDYRTININKNYLAEIDTLHHQLIRLSKGYAPDFRCENYSGKLISLADFRGKIVYITVWATWCKPCIGQIPFEKQLAKKYDKRNIVFMNISIDADKKNGGHL